MRWATFNRFEFEMPEEAVRDCHHQGQCDEDVAYWQGKIDLTHISDADLKAELKEYGAWEGTELNNRKVNEERIIWIAAGNIQEEKEDA